MHRMTSDEHDRSPEGRIDVEVPDVPIYTGRSKKRSRPHPRPGPASGSNRAIHRTTSSGATGRKFMFQQNYDPLGNVFLSTVVAAIPILTLLYFIALHRHRDARGNVHLGIAAP